MKNILKIGIVVFCIIVITVIAIDWSKHKKELAETSKEIEARNREVISQERASRVRIEKIKESLPRVLCWGDSLTAGAGGDGTTFPKVIAQNTGLEVVNYGVGGENAESIAQRQGAMSIYVNEFIIPKGTVVTEINIVDEENNILRLFQQGDKGFNPCEIAGVTGIVSTNDSKDKFFFQRLAEGNEVKVDEKTQVYTYAMQSMKMGDILVIFSGQNNGMSMENVDYIIDIQKSMLKFAGVNRYIIIGLTSSDSSMDSINARMQEVYGEHFLDIKRYLLENGLTDANIMATQQDKTDLEKGMVPSSLRFDDVHGNAYFYKIMGDQITQKLIELEYLTKEQMDYLEISNIITINEVSSNKS